jgi:hypothetical protein
VNPLTEGSWLWRAWRGHSVTFAALFALAMLGVSAVGSFRHVLRELGAPWWLALILPAVLIAVIARKEKDWMPDAERRSKWARWLAAGAIAFVMIAAKLAPDKPEPARPERAESQGRAGVRHP